MFLVSTFLLSQISYFPPKDSDQWETYEPEKLGWCTQKLDSLSIFLEAKKTKGFIILYDGRIVFEEYYGNFTKDSIWYWASAGKSLAAVLMGIAQDKGLLQIEEPSNLYLGKGWTTCTPEQEDQILIRHHLSMTTGLDDQIRPTLAIPDPLNCLEPECLKYMAPPGTRWAYHNAPYRLTQDIIAAAADMPINLFTWSNLDRHIGAKGLWFNYVRFSRPRDMARFGLLVLNEGIWNQDTLLRDQSFLAAMSNSSQSINPSYGYLWWLNGKEGYMLPRFQFLFKGSAIPPAPDDMFMGLGKDDQKVYIIPSQKMVVVRMGENAKEFALAQTEFDLKLWERLSNLSCGTSSTIEPSGGKVKIAPNPAYNSLNIECPEGSNEWIFEVYNTRGQTIVPGQIFNQSQIQIDLTSLSPGVYVMKLSSRSQTQSAQFIKH